MLGWLTNDFTSYPTDIDETPLPGELPVCYTQRLAKEKGISVYKNLQESLAAVISSDTTVYLEHQIYGKPENSDDAIKMLKTLCGKSHLVCTALSVAFLKHGEITTAETFCTTIVNMRSMSDDEIKSYVISGDPMGKAGSYAIQNEQYHPVESIEGCYASVVGFPICHLKRCFEILGLEFAQDPALTCRKNIHYPCLIDLNQYNRKIICSTEKKIWNF